MKKSRCCPSWSVCHPARKRAFLIPAQPCYKEGAPGPCQQSFILVYQEQRLASWVYTACQALSQSLYIHHLNRISITLPWNWFHPHVNMNLKAQSLAKLEFKPSWQTENLFIYHYHTLAEYSHRVLTVILMENILIILRSVAYENPIPRNRVGFMNCIFINCVSSPQYSL